MYFTSDSDRAFEQPQPRPEQPDEAAPGLENSVLENPTSDNPTPGNPTLENPMQLNKDISSKEKTTTDVSITDSIPILSRPSPLEDEAAQPPERKGTEAKSQSAIEIYRQIIMDNIEYEHLCQHAKGIDRETLDEIVDLLVETVCSARKTIRIAGDDYPAELVKSKFMKLDSSHIEFVFDCLSKNTSEIRNIKKYLGGVKHAHDDIPCVRHNEDGKGAFENPAEEHGAVEVVHIVLFHNHVDQLIAHHKGENGRRNGDDHRFGQVLQHGENAAVPVLRGTAHIRRDFPDFGIDCVKQAGQVAHDTVDQDSFDPFPD